MKKDNIFIFDLDGTTINSDHRQGQGSLVSWFRNNTRENIAIMTEGNNVVAEKKTIYLKLVSDPNLPSFFSFKTLDVTRTIRIKKNIKKTASIKSSI